MVEQRFPIFHTGVVSPRGFSSSGELERYQSMGIEEYGRLGGGNLIDI